MGDLVDELMKRHVTLVLKQAGFKRTGATYRLVAPNGDCAIVEFRRWTTSPDVTGFYVHVAVAPMPYVIWMYRTKPDRLTKPRDRGVAMLERVVPPPVEWSLGRFAFDPEQTAWGIVEESQVDDCGRALTAALDEVVPWIVARLDRTVLLATIREHYADYTIRLDQHLGQALLLVDEAPAGEVEALLDAADTLNGNPLPPWIRERLASRQ